jgi:hypothetical protein
MQALEATTIYCLSFLVPYDLREPVISNIAILQVFPSFPLVNIQITMERSTMFNGKTQLFRLGHFH